VSFCSTLPDAAPLSALGRLHTGATKTAAAQSAAKVNMTFFILILLICYSGLPPVRFDTTQNNREKQGTGEKTAKKTYPGTLLALDGAVLWVYNKFKGDLLWLWWICWYW
jgi:hypothetical protein